MSEISYDVIVFFGFLPITIGFWLLWLNFSFVWHALFDGEKSNFLSGFDLIISGFREKHQELLNEDHSLQIQSIWAYLFFRVSLQVLGLPILALGVLGSLRNDSAVFVVVMAGAGILGVIIELEQRNMLLEGSYGGSFALYDLMALIVIGGILMIENSFEIVKLVNINWLTSTTHAFLRMILIILVLYFISRSSSYLGQKKPAAYEKSTPLTTSLPKVLERGIQGSQGLVQVVIIVFLSVVLTSSFYYSIFGREPLFILKILLGVVIFLYCASITLFFSSIQNTRRRKRFSPGSVTAMLLALMIEAILFFS